MSDKERLRREGEIAEANALGREVARDAFSRIFERLSAPFLRRIAFLAVSHSAKMAIERPSSEDAT